MATAHPLPAPSVPSERRSFNIGAVVWFLGLILSLALVLLPIYIMFKFSISDRASIVTGGRYPIPFWPFEPTFVAYRDLLNRPDFLQAGLFSIQVALLTVALSLLLGAPAAFVLARYKIPGLAVLLFLLISIRLFPDISSVIPVAQQFLRPPFIFLPLLVQVALAHTLLGLPYVIYIAQGVFTTIPKDLDEQAQILGASKLYAFLRIILPIALPGLAAAAIYVFLLSWNEFIFAYFLTFTAAGGTTLPVYLLRILAFTPTVNFLAALSVMLSLPVIIFTFVVQRYMIAGMTAGAVK